MVFTLSNSYIFITNVNVNDLKPVYLFHVVTEIYNVLAKLYFIIVFNHILKTFSLTIILALENLKKRKTAHGQSYTKVKVHKIDQMLHTHPFYCMFHALIEMIRLPDMHMLIFHRACLKYNIHAECVSR